MANLSVTIVRSRSDFKEVVDVRKIILAEHLLNRPHDFRVALCLIFKTSPCETIQMKMSLICMKLDVQEKCVHMNGFGRRLVLTQAKGISEKFHLTTLVRE